MAELSSEYVSTPAGAEPDDRVLDAGKKIYAHLLKRCANKEIAQQALKQILMDMYKSMQTTGCTDPLEALMYMHSEEKLDDILDRSVSSAIGGVYTEVALDDGQKKCAALAPHVSEAIPERETAAPAGAGVQRTQVKTEASQPVLKAAPPSAVTVSRAEANESNIKSKAAPAAAAAVTLAGAAAAKEAEPKSAAAVPEKKTQKPAATAKAAVSQPAAVKRQESKTTPASKDVPPVAAPRKTAEPVKKPDAERIIRPQSDAEAEPLVSGEHETPDAIDELIAISDTMGKRKTKAEVGNDSDVSFGKILLIIFLVLCICVSLWVIAGLLVSMKLIPQFDLGFEWFNEHVFSLF